MLQKIPMKPKVPAKYFYNSEKQQMNKSSILLLEYQDFCHFQHHMQGQPAQMHKWIIEKMVKLTNMYMNILPLI